MVIRVVGITLVAGLAVSSLLAYRNCGVSVFTKDSAGNVNSTPVSVTFQTANGSGGGGR